MIFAVMFGAPGLLEALFLPIISIGVLWALFRPGRRTTLVLQKFYLGAAPLPESGALVEIVGRSQGIIAFILTTMGFSDRTRFTVTREEVRCESASLFGPGIQFIPLRCVSTMSAGLHKPMGWLIAAGFILLFGFWYSMAERSFGGLALAIIISAGFAVIYFFSKSLGLEVHPAGGPPICLIFKPSAIEGVPIDVDRALAVIAVIRGIVLRDGAVEELDEAALSLEGDGQWAASADGVPPATIPSQMPSASNVFSPARSIGPPPIVPPQSRMFQPREDNEAVAKLALSAARDLYKMGRRQEAVSKLQRIVDQYPETEAADYARKNLDKLNAQHP